MNVTARTKVDGLAFRQFQYQLLDEGGDIIVGANCSLPFLHAKPLVMHMNLHVLLDSDLTGQTVTFCRFTLGDIEKSIA